jgi:predicted ATP-grasp superfamily ATP-dependent carboligase
LPFAYQGSVGPWPVSERLVSGLRSLGAALASDFDLLGLFGIDYILHDDDAWPVEVNPRYTASVEVLELALGRALLADHLRACGFQPPEERGVPAVGSGESFPRAAGKAILYSRRTSILPDIRPDDAWRRDRFAVPAIADIPWPSQIGAGEPIMTVFATGPEIETCTSRLTGLQDQWLSRLGQ